MALPPFFKATQTVFAGIDDAAASDADDAIRLQFAGRLSGAVYGFQVRVLRYLVVDAYTEIDEGALDKVR